MERDERLLPIPQSSDLQPMSQEYPSSYPTAYEEDVFGQDGRPIREYFNVVYKRLPIILALTILATSVVAFYMYRKPDIYQATTQLIVERPKPKTATGGIVFDVATGDPTYYNTQLKLLNSPDLMYAVVVELGLYKNPNLFKNEQKGLLSTLKSIFSGDKDSKKGKNQLQVIDPIQNQNNDLLDKVTLNPEQKALAKSYASRLRASVTQVERTSLVNISVVNQDPVLAAKVADGIAVTFMKQQVGREIGFDENNLKEITQKIEELKSTIAKQEQELLSIMQNGGIIPSGDGGKSISEGSLNSISTKFFEALDDLRKAEARYTTVRNSGNTAGLSGDDRVPVTNLQQQKAEQRAKLQTLLQDYDKQISSEKTKLSELLVKYTEEYIDVKKTRAKIKQLENDRATTEKNFTKSINENIEQDRKKAYQEVLKGLAAQVQAARTRESQLRSAYNKELAKVNQEGITNTKLTTKRREIDANRKLYDNYLQRQKELELDVDNGRPDNIKIASSAGAEGGLIGPDRNRNIILAFLVSLVGGIGLAFLLDYLDDSIRSSDDIGRNIGLPTLALIPHHSIEKKNSKALPSQLGKTSSALMVLEDNRSPTAEAYRHLRTSLLFSSAGKAPKKILVTSSQPSEGKTTTAINTAITLAQSGAKVVIIDCDLRRPRLHNHFNIGNSFGLTNYLSGEKDTSKIIKDFEGVQNLKIVTSGPVPPNPAELLSSKQMKNFLDTLAGTYDHIIVDSPPAISFTDAAILSTHVDGVVLVAMSGKSSIHLMKRFKQRLGSMGAKIYGVVLNGIKPNSLDYSYYGYGYTYSYYENDDDSTPMLEDDDSIDLLEEEYVEEYEEYEDDEDSIHETK